MFHFYNTDVAKTEPPEPKHPENYACNSPDRSQNRKVVNSYPLDARIPPTPSMHLCYASETPTLTIDKRVQTSVESLFPRVDVEVSYG